MENDYQVIKEYIEKQKIKVVEIFDLINKKIKYSDELQGRKIDKINGEEEIIRAYLLTKLVNEYGYKIEDIEIEKEYSIGHPKNKKARIDIIVKNNQNNIFMFIELKSRQDYEKDKDETIKNQLYSLASQEIGNKNKIKYLVLYTIDIINSQIKDKCIVIDYEKYNNYDDWEKERNSANLIPKNYEKALKQSYIKNGKKDLDINFNPEELNALSKNLHNVLWGGGGTDDNEIFASLTRLILAKLQDELEKTDNEKYDFQVFSYENGDTIETNEDIYNRINLLYRRALKEILNITDENTLNERYVINREKFSLSKLKYVIYELERYSFTKGRNNFENKDILGDFFESIIRDGFKQNKGQFFTHINIVRFILWGLQLDKLTIDYINKLQQIPYLIDSSAGSGTFLIEYMKFITYIVKIRCSKLFHTSNKVKEFIIKKFPNDFENEWAKTFIYGCEINPDLGTSIKVNMVLHGDGAANIFVGSNKGDGLSNFKKYEKTTGENILNKYKTNDVYSKEINEKFDIVISNPPFSINLDGDTKKNIKKEYLFGDKANSENLFIERWYQLLKPNGRLGVVLPESVFDTTENKYIRLFIYKYFKIKAVISLPQIAFEPYTSTKTSLLFAQKKTDKDIKEWDNLWKKYSDEWNYLKTRCENLLEVYLNGKDRNKLPSIKNLTENEEKEILARLLKDYIEDKDKNLLPKELIEKYKDEINELCKYDNDTKDIFGFVNTWWVFGEVAKELNYKIFMAEVEDIGYKRTKRGEKPMPNDLYRTNDNGEVVIDDGIKKTALDYLRDVIWD